MTIRQENLLTILKSNIGMMGDENTEWTILMESAIPMVMKG